MPFCAGSPAPPTAPSAGSELVLPPSPRGGISEMRVAAGTQTAHSCGARSEPRIRGNWENRGRRPEPRPARRSPRSGALEAEQPHPAARGPGQVQNPGCSAWIETRRDLTFTFSAPEFQHPRINRRDLNSSLEFLYRRVKRLHSDLDGGEGGLELHFHSIKLRKIEATPIVHRKEGQGEGQREDG